LHDGGIVESHHDGGDFAGGLKSNEVFAKLMKGELVSTEAQMDNFMKTILPTMISQGPNINNANAGSINIDMPINVAGNLDKSVLPQLEKIVAQAVKQLNTNLQQRGYKRSVDQFSA